MDPKIKRFLAALLLWAMVLSLGVGRESAAAADPAGELTQGDYDRADRVLAEVYALAETPEGAGQIRAYLASVPDVQADSLVEKGEALTWTMDSGIVCSYSPDVRQLMERDGAGHRAEVQTADTEVISYGSQDQTHGSDVYLFEPYYGLSEDFTDHYQTLAKKLAKDSGAAYHYYKGDAATVENIAEALERGGVVIFNSHGTTDYTGSDGDSTSGATISYLCLQTGQGLTAEDYAQGHALYGGVRDGLRYYQVDGTVLTGRMEGPGCGGLVWMAICLGMATEGLEGPLLEAGLGAVYGYSQSVTFKGDACFSEEFFESLLSGGDIAKAAADMKEACGEWDYSPKLCQKAGLSSFYMAKTKEEAQKSRAAFPILVSAEDPYPGKGAVDDTQRVRGTWKLEDRFRITAESQDEAMGSVTVQGLRVIADPAEGYEAADCTVTPAGAAAVTQKGNEFWLSDLIRDCRVTVRFRQRDRGTLTFHLPEGMYQPGLEAYLGDTVPLPEPQGIPETAEIRYRFGGWSETAVPSPEKKPRLLAAGSDYAVTEPEKTLYGVLEYMGDGEGRACWFTLAEDGTDHTGTYAVLSEGYALDCGDAAGRFLPLEQTGMAQNGEILNRPSREWTLRVNRISGTNRYVLRLNGTSSTAYLAWDGIGDGVTATANFGKEEAQWRIVYENGAPVIRNVKDPDRVLRCEGTGGLGRLICAGADRGAALRWYRGPQDLTTWYTSEPLGAGRVLARVESSGEELPAEGTLTIDVKLENETALPKTAVLCLAQYDGSGELLEISMDRTLTAAPRQTAAERVEITAKDPMVRTVKLMVLDREGLRPLCGAGVWIRGAS